jgi:hypothetical protein
MSTTKVIITETSKASDTLIKATAGLNKVMAQLAACTEPHAELLIAVTEAQQKLDAIKEETELAERKAKAELDLRVLENEDKVLQGLMGKRSLAVITNADLAAVKSELNDATYEVDVKINTAVKAAVKNADAVSASLLAKTVAEHSVAVAQKEADILASKREIDFLERQVATLEANAKAEREARVEETKARSTAGAVVVNTTGK